MKNLLLFAVVSISLLASCSKSNDESAALMIRVSNQTSKPVSTVIIESVVNAEPYVVSKNYGNLPTTVTSPYQSIQPTYDLPSVTFIIDGQKQEFIPRCGVGLSLITNGKYSLVLKEVNGQLVWPELIKD